MSAALILAAVKAIPALDSIASKFITLYVAWKREQNAAATTAKDARNDALVDAVAAAGRVRICPKGCPYSGDSA